MVVLTTIGGRNLGCVLGLNPLAIACIGMAVDERVCGDSEIVWWREMLVRSLPSGVRSKWCRTP